MLPQSSPARPASAAGWKASTRPPRGARCRGQHRRLAPADRRPVDPREHLLRALLRQERHRRDLGRGRGQAALCGGRAAARAQDDRAQGAGALVALRGLDPHRLFSRDDDRPAGGGGRHRPGRLPPLPHGPRAARGGHAAARRREGRLGRTGGLRHRLRRAGAARPDHRPDGGLDQPGGGLDSWAQFYEIASHPRCANCHVGRTTCRCGRARAMARPGPTA